MLEQRIHAHFSESIAVKQQAQAALTAMTAQLGQLMATVIQSGHKILACGNGGSAADAQHFAAELVNRFEVERPPLAAIALSTDASILTSIANDYQYNDVFLKQVQALGVEGDLLLAISTSGNSESVVRAIDCALSKKMSVIALTGADGGKIGKKEHPQLFELRVPSMRTARIQEVHIVLIHCLCDAVDHLQFGA